MAKDLTRRLRLIAAYYLGEARFDKTTAIEMAGYKAKNRASLNSMAQELFKKPELQKMIETHIEKIEISQDELLREYHEMATYPWKVDYEAAKAGDINAKAFDTMMRGKIKAISDLLKVAQNKAADQLSVLRSAWEQDRRDRPAVSDRTRATEFAKYFDRREIEDLMEELLDADRENASRLAEAEKDTANPAEFEL